MEDVAVPRARCPMPKHTHASAARTPWGGGGLVVMPAQAAQAGPPDAEAPLARWKPQLKHNQDRLPRTLMRGVGAPQRDLDNGRGRLGSNPVAYDGGSAFLQQRSRWWRMGATFCRAIALLCAGACASWACPKAAPSCAANAVRTAASAAGSAKRQPSMLEAPAGAPKCDRDRLGRNVHRL